MSEQQKATGAEPEAVRDAVPEAGSDAVQDTAPAVGPGQEPADAAPARKVNRRTLALVSGAVGVVVLVGAGLGAPAALDRADRTAETRYWMPADRAGNGSAAPVPTVPPNALMGKLLPMPVEYWPGPDIDTEGNNYYVGAERAVQTFKDAHTGLSGSERDERDKALADLKLKGLAGRSYARRDGHGGAVAEIQLVQADPQELAKFGEFAKKFLALTGSDKDAPKVDGFPEAKCALDAVVEGKKDKIDALDCVAVEGDVLVSFRMYGSKGFAVKDAAGLFKQQLNHLKSPGESA
ncbi:hypothetical protein PV721_16795 [Streptomyces sp. MB09-01]|uniref:hypothetical protein n=1 Tax=Streptomyces sp. MB09-01 TaxID=3028666 RepID=UPI0029B446D2|nr:hypothetical protein [Streptomyces sp. MB09-01]MDX3535998.1 hypothetical protein [Streptomyces sp. MB09-01]